MADKTIPELTDAAALTGSESLHLVQAGESRETTLDEMAAYVKIAETIVPTNLPYRGARVFRNTDATGITFPIVASWQSADFDTDGFWDFGDPTRLTIPAGITKVRFTAQIDFTSTATAGGLYAGLRKNMTGTGVMSPDVPGLPIAAPSRSTAGYTTNLVSLVSGVLPAVEGDFFDIRLNSTIPAVNSILGNGRTWFEIEVVEVG